MLSMSLVATGRGSEFCRASDGVDCAAGDVTNRELLDVLGESNRLSALVRQDQERTEVLMTALMEGVDGDDDAEISLSPVKDKFYEVTSMVLQTECTLGRRVGGRWMPQCGYFQGESFVCLDQLYLDEDSGRDCLVYSFGSGKTEWSLEVALARAGCLVRVFDPFARRPQDLPESVELHPFGISHATREQQQLNVPVEKFKKVRSASLLRC